MAFILAATEQGTLIVNRFDYHQAETKDFYGVGHQLLETAFFDDVEVSFAVKILEIRRRYFGKGVIAVDCGANIGVHTISWARKTTGWAYIYAFEAQERIFYALAGNIALNNCFNATATHAAVAKEDGYIQIPTPDYLSPGSFGSLELRERPENEFIGQSIDYGAKNLRSVRTIALDSLRLRRLDFLKIDVEGMEVEVLEGAEKTIASHKPVILVEFIKVGQKRLVAILTKHGYTTYTAGINILAIHPTDKTINHFKNSYS